MALGAGAHEASPRACRDSWWEIAEGLRSSIAANSATVTPFLESSPTIFIRLAPAGASTNFNRSSEVDFAFMLPFDGYRFSVVQIVLPVDGEG